MFYCVYIKSESISISAEQNLLQSTLSTNTTLQSTWSMNSFCEKKCPLEIYSVSTIHVLLHLLNNVSYWPLHLQPNNEW